jgi:hypothetical protein
MHWISRSVVEITAREELSCLRRERSTFIAATELLTAITSQTPSLNTIAECVGRLRSGTDPWAAEWVKERFFRRKYRLFLNERPPREYPSWVWNDGLQYRIQNSRLFFWAHPPVMYEHMGPDLRSEIPALHTPKEEEIVEEGHQALCTVLNAFPTSLVRWDGMTLEFPFDDTLFGIRPALYYLLRCDYLADVHIARCPWGDCAHKWFRQDRRNQIYCSDACELKHRQKRYYDRKGKKTKADYYLRAVKRRREKKRLKQGKISDRERK